MSWLYSQALVEEYLGDISSDGEQSVQSSGNPTQQAYCAPDKMTAFSRLSRFGMTYKPLTENRGEELLTLFREVFHARTLVPQEKEQELTESDQECGEKWRGSFTKYDPDSSLWKTHQCSLLGDLEKFSETWPQWGLMRDGECWEQRTLEQTIRGTGFGLSLPTPVSSNATSGAVIGKNDKFYQTSTGMPRKVNQNGKDGSVGLGRLVQMWPTPVTRDYKDSGSQEALIRARDKRDSPGLGLLVGAEGGGNLNPMWVEWLMGWPLGWTDLKPLETDKSHFVQQQHGKF